MTNPRPRAQHRRGVLLMVGATLCWATAGMLVRNMDLRDSWEITFWRSLFMALFVAGVLLVMHGRAMPRAVLAVGFPGLLAGLPVETPGMQLDRRGGSGLQAICFASRMVQTGAADLILAGHIHQSTVAPSVSLVAAASA